MAISTAPVTTGDANDYGTLFKVTSAGVLTVLHNFAAQGSTSDGCEPLAPPIQASNGAFYGTTSFCGADGVGTPLVGVAVNVTEVPEQTGFWDTVIATLQVDWH